MNQALKKIISGVICLLLSSVGHPSALWARGGAVSVRGYIRSNGTYVQPHHRSAPDGNPYNNWSFPGNVNPYTGETATGNPSTYLQNHNSKDPSNGGISPAYGSENYQGALQLEESGPVGNTSGNTGDDVLGMGLLIPGGSFLFWNNEKSGWGILFFCLSASLGIKAYVDGDYALAGAIHGGSLIVGIGGYDAKEQKPTMHASRTRGVQVALHHRF